MVVRRVIGRVRLRIGVRHGMGLSLRIGVRLRIDVWLRIDVRHGTGVWCRIGVWRRIDVRHGTGVRLRVGVRFAIGVRRVRLDAALGRDRRDHRRLDRGHGSRIRRERAGGESRIGDTSGQWAG
ncbi:hypothetical protein [Paractinoplanes rhizophilus]|uniref:hypothetical protein n=1 Tax=Paractinoplanes rhizophilus TaxID=1416877 RepID=UPI00366FFCE4